MKSIEIHTTQYTQMLLNRYTMLNDNKYLTGDTTGGEGGVPAFVSILKSVFHL